MSERSDKEKARKEYAYRKRTGKDIHPVTPYEARTRGRSTLFQFNHKPYSNDDLSSVRKQSGWPECESGSVDGE